MSSIFQNHTKHLIDLYQVSIKKKGKDDEVNFTSDLFEYPEGRIYHLIGDESVQKN